MFRLFLVSFITTLTVLSATAQPITVIELKNRTADEMVPVLKPFMGPNDAISGSQYQLFIRANPETLQTVRSFLATLDKAPAQLLISIQNTGQTHSDSTGIGISGNKGSRIIINNSNEPIRIKAEQNKNISTQRQEPSIRATEGKPALIYAGISVPVKISQRQRQSGRIIEQELIDYKNVQSGFYVTARLNGENVILDIEPQSQSLGENGSINSFSLATSASGKLGKWIPLGGVATTDNKQSKSLTGITTGNRQDTNQIRLKVEKLEDQ